MRTDQDERTSTSGWPGEPGGEEVPSDQQGQEPARSDANDTEADILRTELRRVREKTAALEQELVEAKDRVLRYRAEMETMRRRQQGELQQARDQGKDETIMPVLAVYDDLERALAAAASTEDQGGIVAGVKLVKENLERQLAHLGIRRTGTVGEEFDPQVHEALSTVPAGPGRPPGTIFQVFEPGFLQGDRLIRVARVVVVADSDAN